MAAAVARRHPARMELARAPSARRRRPRIAGGPHRRCAATRLLAPAHRARITHDLRYGWRQMLRRPALSLASRPDARPRHRRQRHDVQLARRPPARTPHRRRSPDRIVALNGTSRTRNDLSVVSRLSGLPATAARYGRRSRRLQPGADEHAHQRRSAARVRRDRAAATTSTCSACARRSAARSGPTR